MSAQARRIFGFIIEAAKISDTQKRLNEIGRLTTRFQDTLNTEYQQREAAIHKEYADAAAKQIKPDVVPRFQYDELARELKNLEATVAAEKAAEQELKDKHTGPGFILSLEEIKEIFNKHEDSQNIATYITCNTFVVAVQECLEKAWNKGTPANRWKIDAEEDPHKGRYDGERSELALGKFTDDELANGAFLNYDVPFDVHKVIAGTQIPPIAWMTGVKDRIRWLSRKLETVLAQLKNFEADKPLLEYIRDLKSGERLGLFKTANGVLQLELGNQDFREVMGMVPPKEIIVNRESMIKAIGTDDIDGWFNQQLKTK